MKLKKKTAPIRGSAERRPMDKIHVGFEVQTGEDGYNAVKAAVDQLREQGYSVNARTLTLIVADQISGGKVDKVLSGLEDSLNMAAEFIKTASPEDIVNEAVKATGE